VGSLRGESPGGIYIEENLYQPWPRRCCLFAPFARFFLTIRLSQVGARKDQASAAPGSWLFGGQLWKLRPSVLQVLQTDLLQDLFAQGRGVSS